MLHKLVLLKHDLQRFPFFGDLIHPRWYNTDNIKNWGRLYLTARQLFTAYGCGSGCLNISVFQNFHFCIININTPLLFSHQRLSLCITIATHFQCFIPWIRLRLPSFQFGAYRGLISSDFSDRVSLWAEFQSRFPSSQQLHQVSVTLCFIH